MATKKPTAQNSGKSARKVGRPFQKGVSGNPGGRPKGLRALIESKYPGAREKIAALYMLVAFGSKKQLARRFGALEVPDLDDRLEAASWLADRLDGKPTQSHELSGPSGGPIETQDAADVARASLLEKLGTLAQRVDGIAATKGKP